MTRSSLAWAYKLISPISSRNNVPPSASANLPRTAAVAPVNAPRVCPNSSDSIKAIGQRATINNDERPGCAGAKRMYRLRYPLLTGARFASNKHGGSRPRNFGQISVQSCHRWAMPDESRRRRGGMRCGHDRLSQPNAFLGAPRSFAKRVRPVKRGHTRQCWCAAPPRVVWPELLVDAPLYVARKIRLRLFWRNR